MDSKANKDQDNKNGIGENIVAFVNLHNNRLGRKVRCNCLMKKKILHIDRLNLLGNKF